MDMQMINRNPLPPVPASKVRSLPRRRVVLDLLQGGGGRTRANAATQSAAPRRRVVFECEDLELLALAAEGLPPGVIGSRLGLSERTVRRRLTRLCERLGVSTTVEAIVIAVRH